MRIEQPFHEGELEAQRRAGETAAAARNGKAIGDEIMPGALKFIEQQRLAAVASIDAVGNVWASLLQGTPGFLSSPDRRHVDIDLDRVDLDEGDPLWSNLRSNPQLGMLLIEFDTRRRLRINGRASWVSPRFLRLAVDEAYPNCPQYIRRRHVRLESPTTANSSPIGGQDGSVLTSTQRHWIASAETFFVASAHATRGADVSHRGGAAGFVSVIDDHTLRVPDYAGNGMFNTLGNLTLDPRAGLVFLDFDSGRTLQLLGRAEIQWRSDEGGLRHDESRSWDFHVEHWREAAIRAPLGWELDPEHPPRLSW